MKSMDCYTGSAVDIPRTCYSHQATRGPVGLRLVAKDGWFEIRHGEKLHGAFACEADAEEVLRRLTRRK